MIHSRLSGPKWLCAVLLVLIGVVICSPGVALAQSEATEASPAPAAADELPSSEDLRLTLLPLTREEVKAAVDEWRGVLKERVETFAEARRSGDDEAIRTARQNVEAVITRVDTAIEAFEAKGGDAEEYRQYVRAVASEGPGVDAADANAVAEYFGDLMRDARDWLLSTSGGVYWAGRIILFFVIVIAFAIIANIVARIVRKAVGRLRNVSSLLQDFFANITRQAIFIVGIVVALGQLGIEVGPVLAAIGGIAFIIGFALQGTLSNFAAGIMILMYRPYDIGNYVNVAGVAGTVESMTLVSTTVLTPDNQRIVIPNGSIWGNVITNVTGNETRRVDLTFGISYTDDIDKAIRILDECVRAHPKTLDDPAPNIRVGSLGDSSVNIICRPWSKTSDYWDVYWDLQKIVKQRFDAEDVTIPFPQRDVHLFQQQPANA